jgi:hypothetical protein
MSDSEFEAEFEEIHKQFPDAQFSISLSLDELDNVVINSKKVAIKCDFTCYCYSEAPRNSEYFILKSTKGITNRDLINCLIENKFDPSCNHYFLEQFQIDTPSQVSVWFGS